MRILMINTYLIINIVPEQQLVVTATCRTSNLTVQQGGEHWISMIRIIVLRMYPAFNKYFTEL